MLKIKKYIKTLAFISILCMVFLQTLPVYTKAATLVDPTTIGGTGITLNPNSANTTNSSVTNKQGGSTVSISFNADNAFKNGSIVTAMASTVGFLDNTDKLYFTWYMKHGGCDLTENWWDKNAKEDDKTKLERCDMDGDNLITPNDWKITASRIIVDSNFNEADANYSSTAGFIGAVAGGTEAIPSVTASDGWIENFKRDGNGNLAKENDVNAPNCYVQQPSSGLIYELRRTQAIFNPCPSGYHPSCIKNTTAICDVLNPAWTQTNVDTANAHIITINDHFTKEEAVPVSDYVYSGSLFDQAKILAIVTDNAAHIGNPGYPKLLNYDDHVLPQKTISNDFSTCAVKNEDTNKNAENLFDCAVKNETDFKQYHASLACKDDSEISLCVKDDADTDLVEDVSRNLLGRIFKKDKVGADNNTNGVCSTLAEPNKESDPLSLLFRPPAFLDNTHNIQDSITKLPLPTSVENCSNLANGLTNGVFENSTTFGIPIVNGIALMAGNTALSPTCTFEKKENLCKHLFPYFPKKTVTVDGKNIDLSDEITGDGKFTLKEKEFWGANPSVASTNRKGTDEANVMGLGIDNISWTYTTGDEIGVAVEGTTSLTTDHNDSSYRTMWAFSKGTCTALSEIESRTSIDAGTRAFYTEDNGTVGILTADFDLDRCLDENLAAPDDNGLSNMKVDLTAMPDNPINDPDGTSGDSVTVMASAQNVTDLSSVFYNWKIEKSSDGMAVPNETTKWTDITSDMITKYNSLSSADKQGLGKNSLTFLLNLPSAVVDPDENGVFYLRVRVIAAENSGAGNQTSLGLIVLRVQEQQNKIVAYSVIAGDDGNLSLNNGIGVEPICNTLLEKSTCYTTQNKIIGLQVPNTRNALSGFSWKVNNVSMPCDSSVSVSACNGTDNNVLFFPILGNIGESVDVVARAVNKKTGGTVEITRHFVVVAPQVTISSADTTNAWPKLMGYYKDLDGNRTPDSSSQVFETNSGKTVTFNANVYSSWGQNPSFDWAIDGELQNNGTNQLAFVVGKDSGDSYDIGLILANAHTPEQDRQSNNLRKALLKNWGISPENSVTDENISDNIQLNVVDNPSVALVASGKTGIFASLITNLPEQLMFLLKIVLTAFVLLFSMGLLFSFMPESVFEKNKNDNS